MEEVCGEFNEIIPKHFSRKIGNKNALGRWRSKMFRIGGHSDNFCFTIQPIGETNEYGELRLWAIGKHLSKAYNLVIFLKYSQTRKTFSRAVNNPEKRRNHFLYRVVEVELNNLVEICLMFYERPILNLSDRISGKYFCMQSMYATLFIQ